LWKNQYPSAKRSVQEIPFSLQKTKERAVVYRFDMEKPRANLLPRRNFRLASKTNFSESEVKELFYLFMKVSKTKKNDAVIDQAELQKILDIKSQELAKFQP
jgi:hypothetical protein